MKKKMRIGLISALIMLVLSVGIVHPGFNPFSKKDWEQVGKTIKSGFELVGDWFEDQGKKLIDKLKNLEYCAQVVPLGAEWAAKRGAYEVATGVLEVAKKLQDADPRRIAIKAEIAALQAEKAALVVSNNSIDATQKVARVGLDVTQALANVTGDITQFLSQVAGVVTIDSAGFRTGFKSLKQGNIVGLTLKGSIVGKNFNIDNFQFNYKSLTDGIGSLAKSIISVVSGGKIKKEDLDKLDQGTLIPDLPTISLPDESPETAGIDQTA